MKSLIRTLLLSVLIFTVGCGGKAIRLNPEANKVVSKKILALWGTDLKDKGKKFDVNFFIKNESDYPITFSVWEMSCAKGDVEGTVQHHFFNAGKKQLDMPAKTIKNYRFACLLGDKVEEGDHKIMVNNVYDTSKDKPKLVIEKAVWVAEKGFHDSTNSKDSGEKTSN